MEQWETRDEWRDRMRRRTAARVGRSRRTARQATQVALGGLLLAVWVWWRSFLAWLGGAGLEEIGDGILGVLVALWTLCGCFWLLASLGGAPRERMALAITGVLWIAAGLLVLLLATP